MPFLGSYQLLTRIATGGMAEVFLARRAGAGGFSKVVALKRILPAFSSNPEFVAMFLNEAKLSGELQHPNIVQSLELGRDGDTYFLAMEYVDGPTLRDVIRAAQAKHERMPPGVALKIISLVLEGLGYAHELRGADGELLQLVHRDISPHNVLLGRSGTVKVADFGIARAASISSVTKTGSIRGKVRYMSPEQLENKILDGRSDLFAVGITLFEALTGQRPFAGDSEAEVITAILGKPPPRLETLIGSVPAPLQALLDRALAKNRDERFASAAQMQAEVEATLVQLGHSVRGSDIGALVAAHCPPNPQIAEALNLPEEPLPEPEPEPELEEPEDKSTDLDMPLPTREQLFGTGPTVPPAAARDRRPVETLWTHRGAAAWGASSMPEAPPREVPRPRPAEPELPLAQQYGPTDKVQALERPPPPSHLSRASVAVAIGVLALGGAAVVGLQWRAHQQEEAAAAVVAVPRPQPKAPLEVPDAGPVKEVRIAALPPAAPVDAGPASAVVANVPPTPDTAQAVAAADSPPASGGRSARGNGRSNLVITPGHDSHASWLITPSRSISRGGSEDDELGTITNVDPMGPPHIGTGTLIIHVRPQAVLAIDDEEQGPAKEFTATLEAGDHVLRIWAVTGQNQSLKIYLRPSETKELNFNF